MRKVGWMFALGACLGGVLLGRAELPEEPCRAALLVVDAQNIWVLRDSMLTVDGDPLLGRIEAALARFRECAVPIIFIKDTSWATVVSSEKLAFPREIRPNEGEPIVRKRFPNAFKETELDATLRAVGVRHLVISGLGSDACVKASVEGAIALGYEVTILADVHSGGQDGVAAAAMNAEWSEQGLPVVRLDELDVAGLCPEETAEETAGE